MKVVRSFDWVFYFKEIETNLEVLNFVRKNIFVQKCSALKLKLNIDAALQTLDRTDSRTYRQ